MSKDLIRSKEGAKRQVIILSTANQNEPHVLETAATNFSELCNEVNDLFNINLKGMRCTIAGLNVDLVDDNAAIPGTNFSVIGMPRTTKSGAYKEQLDFMSNVKNVDLEGYNKHFKGKTKESAEEIAKIITKYMKSVNTTTVSKAVVKVAPKPAKAAKATVEIVEKNKPVAKKVFDPKQRFEELMLEASDLADNPKVTRQLQIALNIFTKGEDIQVLQQEAERLYNSMSSDERKGYKFNKPQ